MKKINITAPLLGLLFCAGCVTQRNAEKYYERNPDKLARKCASVFQQVDSTGEPVIVYVPVDNPDYTAEIDSLTREADALVDKLQKDSAQASQVSQECAKIVAGYKDQVKTLSAKITALNANYKKPAPDTLKVEVVKYRLPPSYVAREQVYKNDIDTLEKKLAATTFERDDYQEKATTRSWIIGGLVTVLGIGVFLKIKGIV